MAISKKRVINAIYKVTSPLTASLYRDDAWQGVSNVISAIRTALNGLSSEFTLNVSVENGGYRSSNDGMSKYKEYLLEVVNADGKRVLGGHLNAHGAGTLENPFERYDMTVVLY